MRSRLSQSFRGRREGGPNEGNDETNRVRGHGPSRRVVFPELLKRLLEEVRANRFQVVAEEIAKPEMLFGAGVLTAAGGTANETS